MATRTEVLIALKKLSVYYGKETPRERAEVYQEALIDLEPEAIEYAVQTWIRKSPFFPRVCELREVAGEYRGPVGTLSEAFLRMCDEFYFEARLDPAAWEDLAKAFDRAGRVYMAMNVREKFKRFTGIVAQKKGKNVRGGAM